LTQRNGFDENSQLKESHGRKNWKNCKRIKERFILFYLILFLEQINELFVVFSEVVDSERENLKEILEKKSKNS
jgi:hypothetical protein